MATRAAPVQANGDAAANPCIPAATRVRSRFEDDRQERNVIPDHGRSEPQALACADRPRERHDAVGNAPWNVAVRRRYAACGVNGRRRNPVA